MIIRSAIDSVALQELLEQPARLQRRSHTDLTQFLRDYGTLWLTGDTDGSELIRTIRTIAEQSPALAQLWSVTLKHLHGTGRVRTARPQLDESTSQLCRLRRFEALTALADVLVVSEELADSLGFSETGTQQLAGQLEMTTADSIRSTVAIISLLERMQVGNFPSGTDREEVWNTVFGPLASHSVEVTILDRYLFRRLHQGAPKHVQWILNRLDEAMPSNAGVRILGEFPQDLSSLDEVERRLRSHLETGRKNVSRVDIHLSPWRVNRNNGPHNRHMRFSCGSAISVDEGFDRLSNTRIWGHDGFTWKFRNSDDSLVPLAVNERYVLDHSRLSVSLIG